MPALESPTEGAEIRIAEHERDGCQIVVGIFCIAHRYALSNRQDELVECNVAFLQLPAKAMHREPHAPSDGTDGRIATLALALDDVCEQAEPAVPVAAQVRDPVRQSELMTYQGLHLGERPLVTPWHRQTQSGGIDQDCIGALIEDRVSEYALVVPPRTRATMLEVGLKRLPRHTEEVPDQSAQRRNRHLRVL